MRAWIALLGVLGIVTTSALGFAANRSSAATSGSAIWSVPNSDNDPRASIEMLLNEKMFAADLDNILRDSSEVKKSVREQSEKCSPSSEESQRLKRSEDVLLNGTRIASRETNVTEAKESTLVESSSPSESKASIVTTEETTVDKVPRNVVLVLTDGAEDDQIITWQDFGTAHKFPVHGSLDKCRRPRILDDNISNVPQNSPAHFQMKKGDCECERFLQANVEGLMSWARRFKEMSTATVSTTNFSIPSSFAPEGATIQVNNFEDNEEMSGLRRDVPRSRSDIKDNWHMIDLDRQSTPSASSESAASPAKQDGINGYDGMLGVFDMFSRIRIAFFRILLESLGNLSGPEEEFAGRKSWPLKPSTDMLVHDALIDLKSAPNGFMLVVAAPGNEVSAVVDILRSEISAEETLLVVTGICPKKINSPIPFYAEGPGAKSVRQVRTVWDLPGYIRSALSKGCRGEACGSEHHADPVALPSLELLPSPQDVPRKRVIRAKDEDETTQSDSTTEEKSSKEVVEDVEENKSTPQPEKRSENGAENMRIDAVAAFLGIATSVTAMLALNS